MSNFYLSDSRVLTDNRLSSFDFRVYSYLCKEFNIQTLKPFVRLLDIKGFFQTTQEEVEKSINNLIKIKVDNESLLTVNNKGCFLEFDMPRHRSFLKSLKFEKFNSKKGWNIIKESTQQTIVTNYKFPKLDSHQLYDALMKLPIEEFKQIKSEDLMFPWVLKDVSKNRRYN